MNHLDAALVWAVAMVAIVILAFLVPSTPWYALTVVGVIVAMALLLRSGEP